MLSTILPALQGSGIFRVEKIEELLASFSSACLPVARIEFDISHEMFDICTNFEMKF